MYVVQAALMHTVCEEQFLDRGRSLDLGSERCWVLAITTVVALGIATITITASTITAFSLRFFA